MRKNKTGIRMLVACAALAAAASAFALKTDRDQQMLIDADHQTSKQSLTNGPNDPDVTLLDGDVKIVQGSLKAHGDHAEVYKNPAGIADESGTIGGIKRIILTGKPAHMEQVHDGDCNLMTADALKIDFNNVTGIATLTTSVVVVQEGKSQFHGENMIYNTNTGEMDSGDRSPGSRVHTVIEPKSDKPAASTNNCGFPGTPTPKTPKTKK